MYVRATYIDTHSSLPSSHAARRAPRGLENTTNPLSLLSQYSLSLSLSLSPSTLKVHTLKIKGSSFSERARSLLLPRTRVPQATTSSGAALSVVQPSIAICCTRNGVRAPTVFVCRARRAEPAIWRLQRPQPRAHVPHCRGPQHHHCQLHRPEKGHLSPATRRIAPLSHTVSSFQQVRNAKRILPLRKRGNLLLCTLLIGNTVVNVLLAVVTDPIWRYAFGDGIEGQVLSLVIPSAIIVLLGEIIPQSVCSRYALEVGAASLPLTYVFVILILPCSIPIALLLDRLLGAEIGSVYTREGLMQLVKLNVESAAHAKESGLTSEDARLLGGALTFRDRTVGEVMTPIERVYMLPIDTALDKRNARVRHPRADTVLECRWHAMQVLDRDAFLGILERGHTRIPVYDGDRANIVLVPVREELPLE